MGVPNVACHFQEIAMLHVSVAYFPQCNLSNLSLRKGYVPCFYIFSPHVACHYSLMLYVKFKKCPCRTVDFRGQGPS